MSKIYLKLGTYTQVSLEEIAKEAVDLATKLGINIEFDYGCGSKRAMCTAWPNTDYKHLVELYNKSLGSDAAFKYVSSRCSEHCFHNKTIGD